MDYVADNDGWTRDDGRVEGSKPNIAGERLYNTLEFSYRPATPMEAKGVHAKVNKFGEEPDDYLTLKSELTACDFIASKLKTWNLKDRGGHSVPIKPETVANLHPFLWTRLYAIIRGVELSDPKPGRDTMVKALVVLERDAADLRRKIEAATEADVIPPSDAELVGNSPAVSG